ncbi:ATP-dependent zinc protease family protein [Flocculibacter collagenilyticus]|uniref:ATP-dependent zinc protease family protein n=1 Tax=Flocculibacter collagenilyticus TaxID=2744479 RepID=UPI0018F50034|nr:RimK/LysX family protein [Flocculibacter collagenilyticus]
MKKINSKLLVGALEHCDLPLLNIEHLDTRIDTGAATSSLHVDNITEFFKEQRRWISFDIHPDVHNVSQVERREAEVLTEKTIKSSNGQIEHRYTILTDIVIGEEKWEIQVTLTDRSSMSYLMLLGREAMIGRLVVDPELEFVQD